MKDYQLAWKNLWRNRRRTLITAMSIFFAVFFALIMRAFQLGTYDKLYKDVIEILYRVPSASGGRLL